MRQARLKAPEHDDVAYYHCLSRVVNREFILGEEEREQFVEMMRCYEHFCGHEGQTDYWMPSEWIRAFQRCYDVIFSFRVMRALPFHQKSDHNNQSVPCSFRGL